MPDVLPTSYVGKVHLPPLRKKLRGNVAGANGSSWGSDGKERGKKNKARRAIAWGTEEFHVVGKPCQGGITCPGAAVCPALLDPGW